MHPRGPSTALFLAMIVLIAGLLTSCGGGDQSGSGSQQGGGAKQQGGAAKGKRGKNAPEKKMALGTIGFINPKTERFTVHLSSDEQGKKPVIFKLAKKGKITLGGKKAGLGDMKKGQQAQVTYVVRKDSNRALRVKLFEGGGSSKDDNGGEKTGGEKSGGGKSGGEKTGGEKTG
jgi:hypothetical protein